MKPLYISIFAIVAIVFLYLAGGFFSEQCVSVGKNKACWKTIPAQVNSTLCPANNTCIAEPYLQQHNAIVDSVVLACADAKKGDYADDKLNKRIEEVIKEAFSYDMDARQLCEQPGMILTKRFYE
ncbi:MAG TPA: hypothetical protein VJB11_01050 [archaeon]|nr:hypothetical protein [archaeon]